MVDNSKEISGPLDATRSNLYEIRNLIQAVCDRLGVPPPQEPNSLNPVNVDPITVIDRVEDALSQSKSALFRLMEVNDFISKI